MSQITAVSFDADAIRVITANRSGSNLTVKSACSFNELELAEFLSHDDSSEYIVIINFIDTIYDTITIPPVEQKLVSRLVQAEIRKEHPDIPPFTCGWKVIADIAQEGRTIRKVACCLAENSFLSTALEPFIQNNRIVKQIVSMPNSLAGMVAMSNIGTDETLLCAHDGNTQKTIFVLEHGAVTFVRQVPSDSKGWSDFDRQNITMTLDYCFQSLRIRPSRTIALNAETVIPPLASFEPPEGMPGVPELFMEYQHLIAALAYPPAADTGLLPDSYKEESKQQDILKTGIKLFTVAIIAILIISSYVAYSVKLLKNDIAMMRERERELPIAISNYNKSVESRNSIEPVLNALTANNALPSIPAFMKFIPSAPPSPAFVTSLQIKKDKESLNIQITGIIKEPNYSVSQDLFEQYANRLASIAGVTITSKKMDSKEQTFLIEAGYRQ